jgi:hypothetical protein
MGTVRNSPTRREQVILKRYLGKEAVKKVIRVDLA